MSLKVIRYKNYGWTITGGEETDEWEDRFYWSIYKLNNGEIVVLNNIEYWKKNKLIDNDYDFSYANHELKNGDFINFEFGNAKADDKEQMSKEFYDWFESCPPVKNLKKHESPSLKEEKCVKDFFMKNIMKTKEVPTNIVNV